MIQAIVSCIFVILAGWFITAYIQRQYNKYHSRQLLAYCPTVWTSLGILGTFCSIVWSLTADSDYRDVSKLISNISPAFWTSIVGILGAIFYSIKVKKLFAQEDSVEENSYKAASDQTPEVVLATLLKTTERTNSILTEQIHDLKQEQINNTINTSELFETLNKTIKEECKLSRDNVTTFQNNTIESEKKLSSSLQENVKKNSSEQQAILNKIFNIITDSKNSIIKKQDESINVMSSQNNVIENFVANLIKQLESFYNNVLNKTNESTLQLIEDHFVKYESILDKYNNLLVENSTAEIKKHTQALEKVHDDIINDIKNQFEQTHEVYSKACDKISNGNIAQIDTIIKKMTDFISHIEENVASVDSLVSKHSTEVHNRIDAESNSLNQIYVSMKEHTAFITQSMQKMNQDFLNSLKERMEEMSSKYEQILVQYSKSISDNSSAEIKEHNQALENIHNEIIKNVKEQFVKTSGIYCDTYDKISKDNISQIEIIIKTLTSFISQIQSNVESVDSLVTKHTLEVHNRIEAESKSLENIYNTVKNSSSSTSKSIGDMLASLSGTVESVKGMTDHFTNSLSAIQNTTTSNITEISKSTTDGIQALSNATANQLKKMNEDVVKMSKERIEQEFDVILKSFKNDSQKLITDVSEFRNQLANNEEERAASIYRGFDEKISTYIDKLTQALQKDTAQIDNFLTKMQITNNGRLEVLETLKTVLLQISEERKLINESIKTTTDNIGVVKIIRNTLENTSEGILKLVYHLNLLVHGETVEVIDGKKICPECNSENPAEANFCTSCGRKI